jgi:hypothetical protein
MVAPIRNRAVPVDFSSYFEAAVAYAALLARRCKASITLINIIDQRGLDRFIRYSDRSLHPVCLEKDEKNVHESPASSKKAKSSGLRGNKFPIDCSDW